MNQVFEDVEMSGTAKQSMSFRDKLVGNSVHSHAEDVDDWTSEDEEDLELEEDSFYPLIKVTKEEKRRICQPWRHSFIIKLLGRPIGYKTLLVRIPKASSNLVVMDNGYFLVKFSSMDDYDFTKYRGS